MAYFTWKGIDLTGTIARGKLFARSAQELDELLLKQEIALLSYAPVKESFWRTRRISSAQTIAFFRSLAQLLDAGVLLPDALTVIYSQIHHGYFQQIVAHIADIVNQGSSLSQALAVYPAVFDSAMIHMVHVGQESGQLTQALQLLTEYLTVSHEFKAHMRSASLVPLITLGFFTTISLVIFIFIIPQFVSMFASVKQELPLVTRAMIQASAFMQSAYMFIVLAALGVVLVGTRLWINTKQGQWLWHSILLRIPYIGNLVIQNALAHFLQSMAMLVGGGMHMVPALAVAQHMVANKRIAYHLACIEAEVQAGSSLSQAMMYEPGQIFGPQAIAIIKVGEESGRLTVLLAQTAQMYQHDIKKKIALLTTLINPLLMIVLGILITFLVFAVYLPVFTLSNVI